MIVAIILLIIGFVLLYYGAEFLVSGSSKLARGLGISPMVIGLTIVALGTSLPEAFVSLVAVFKGNSSICLSNIIGSNIANIGLILGCSALLAPLKVDRKLVSKELPIMLGATLLFLLFCWDNKIARWEGIVLFCLFLGFNYFILKTSNKLTDEKDNPPEKNNTFICSLKIIGGFVLLTFGASVLVDNAVFIAGYFGMPTWIIGLTIIALGTSLPELATSITSAIKKEAEISMGNVIGSNIFNILFVVGLSAIISPLHLDGTATGSFTDLIIMTLFSLLLIPLIKSRYILARWEGLILLTGYILFVVFTIIRH